MLAPLEPHTQELSHSHASVVGRRAPAAADRSHWPRALCVSAFKGHVGATPVPQTGPHLCHDRVAADRWSAVASDCHKNTNPTHATAQQKGRTPKFGLFTFLHQSG